VTIPNRNHDTKIPTSSAPVDLVSLLVKLRIEYSTKGGVYVERQWCKWGHSE